MSKSWVVIQYTLSQQTRTHRELLYKEFAKTRTRWSDNLLNALYLVVVELQPQVVVARKLKFHKQEVNRAVRKYKDYLLT
jgi:hypothetical protein